MALSTRWRRRERRRPLMPVIVGAPRSGTTLLRLMLDAHPQLAIPPETGFLSVAADLQARGADGAELGEVLTSYPPQAPTWPDFGLDAAEFRAALLADPACDTAAALRLFYRRYAERHGKPRWGDKTPGYVLTLPQIASVLPEARFIHIVRDGRDVAASLRKRWFSPGDAMAVQAEFWARHVNAGRAYGATSDRYCEVRYEALLAEPETELRRVCQFVELRYDEAMLHYYERAPDRLREHGDRRQPDGTIVASHAQRLDQQALTMQPPQRSRAGAWRQALTGDEVAEFERVAGGLLRELGYPA